MNNKANNLFIIRVIFASCVLLLLSSISGHAAPVTNIVAGDENCVMIESDGSLWTVGDNLNGELGDGTTTSRSVPEPIVPGGVTAIANGGLYTMFVKSDGSLWGMGYNGYGQIGNGKTSNSHTPVEAVSNNVVAVSAENFTTLFIEADDSLWGMGNNGNGQIGNGATMTTNRPQLIVASNVVAVAAGGYHSLFIKTDGSLWAMGYNGDGELGDGTFNSTNQPEEIMASNVVAISAGLYHSLFLKSDGSLWAMGYNGDGELGDGTYNNTNQPDEIVTNNVTAISGGYNFSFFLKSDGSLWAMGDDTYGELGDGVLFNNATGFYISTNQPDEILSSNVATISGGGDHSIFMKSDGSLCVMGEDDFGQLGNGITTSDEPTPEHILFAQISATPPFTGITPLTVQFNGPAVDDEGNAITNWTWFFNDSITNTTTTNQNLLHTYASDGTYVPTFIGGMNNKGGQVLAMFPVDFSNITSASSLGLVLNGGFEAGSFYGWTTNGNVNGTVQSGLSHAGSHSALWRPAGSPGFLSQTLATTAGARYLLSFWAEHSPAPPTNDLNVSWNGALILNNTNPLVAPPVGWTNFQFLVTATNSASLLQFGFQSDRGGLYYLDDVSVTPAALQTGITNFAFAGTDLVIRGTNAVTDEINYVLMTTNLATPLSQWTPVATNIFQSGGRFSITNLNVVNPAAPQRFYVFEFY